VVQVYRNTRGLKLPGNYKHVFLSELYHEQSSQWPAIAAQHLRRVHNEAASFAQRALGFLANDKRVGAEVLKIVNANLEENFQAAQDELRKICDDERGPPLTYNHYYTDTIQKSRQSKWKKIVKVLNLAPENRHGKVFQTSLSNEALAATFEDGIIFDMNKATCQEAIEALDAYYKVSPLIQLLSALINIRPCSSP
jgi:TPR repeat protein